MDLKGFDEETYMRLNSGHLQPVLDAILTLKSAGVWVEIINLIVPTYTDNVALIRQMCGWIAESWPGCSTAFLAVSSCASPNASPPTPVETLLAAREQARAAGLRYV